MQRLVCFVATIKVDEDLDGEGREDEELVQVVQDAIGHTGAAVQSIEWSEIPA